MLYIWASRICDYSLFNCKVFCWRDGLAKSSYPVYRTCIPVGIMYTVCVPLRGSYKVLSYICTMFRFSIGLERFVFFVYFWSWCSQMPKFLKLNKCIFVVDHWPAECIHSSKVIRRVSRCVSIDSSFLSVLFWMRCCYLCECCVGACLYVSETF